MTVQTNENNHVESSEFEDIYNRFYAPIHRYLKHLVSESEAEDLAQEVFIKVAHGLKDFRGDSKLSTWLYRIATNAAMDKLRSKSFIRDVKHRVSIDAAPGEENMTPPEIITTSTGGSTPVDQQMIREDMNRCIREFIEGLSGSYRSVVVLSELEGFKNKEIAAILGISLDTVKIRLHRAREKLKKKLEQGCTFYHDTQNVLSCDRNS
jgi:RNA polymerase sigma-70 factor (ECF subfamily)